MRSLNHLFGKALVLWAVFAAHGIAFCAPEDTVARIGEKTISVRQFEHLALELMKTGYHHIEEMNRQSKRELLDGIIARELLVMEGLRRGYDRDSTIAEFLEKVRRRAVMKKLYEQEAVQKSYSFTEEELRKFFHDRQYDVEVLSQHIVCDSEKKAREVLSALKDGVPFESLVAIYSIPSIQNRFGPTGVVGWFKIGEVLEELREPMMTMEPGTVYPEPVKTGVGYHVFRLQARRPVDFEASRKWVEEQARIQRRADDMERYVKKLRRQYRLKLHPEGFNALLRLPKEAGQWTGKDLLVFTWKGGRLTTRDYMEQVARGSARHPALLDSAGLHKDADNLAGKQIMMAEAHRLGIDDGPDIRAAVEKERNKLLVKRLYQAVTKKARHISDEEVRAFYDRHIDQFTRKDGKTVDFSIVEKGIRRMLRARAGSQAMDDFLDELRKKYKDQIEVFPEVLDLAFASGDSSGTNR